LGTDLVELFDRGAPEVQLEELTHTTVRPLVDRRWLPAVSILAVVLAVGLISWAVVSGGPTEPVASSIPPTSGPQEGPEVLPIAIEERIPATIVAVRPNSPSFAILDFESAATTIYPPGVHRSTLDATDGVGVTPDGHLIVTTNSHEALLFQDGLDEDPVVFRPESPRSISGLAPVLHALMVPPDGQRMWLVQPGIGDGANDYPTLIELVDVSTGSRLLQTETAPETTPVGATYSGLVLESVSWTDTGDGFITEPGSERALLLTDEGELNEIGPGQVLEAGADTVVRTVCPETGDPCELAITDSDGSNLRGGRPPIDGEWIHLGGPGIPSTSFPLRGLSPNGSSLIMGVASGFDVNSMPENTTLVIVDVQAATTQILGEIQGLTTWSRDSDRVVIIDQHDVSFIVVDFNVGDPGQVITVEDVIPPDHFALAAG
jgi:hypothetical protein